MQCTPARPAVDGTIGRQWNGIVPGHLDREATGPGVVYGDYHATMGARHRVVAAIDREDPEFDMSIPTKPQPWLRPTRVAVSLLAVVTALLLMVAGCAGEEPAASTAAPGTSTSATSATTASTATTVATGPTASAPTTIGASATTAVTAGSTSTTQGPSTTATSVATSTTKPAAGSTTSTTKRPATTTTTAAPTTTTTATIPPLPDGAELQVITPEGKAVAFTLDDLAALPLHRTTLEGKIQEGPLLLDVLHAAGVTAFTKVVITGSRGPVFVNIVTADQVDDQFLLDFTNHGTVKVASPVFGLEDRNAKDIFLIQAY